MFWFRTETGVLALAISYSLERLIVVWCNIYCERHHANAAKLVHLTAMPEIARLLEEAAVAAGAARRVADGGI